MIKLWIRTKKKSVVKPKLVLGWLVGLSSLFLLAGCGYPTPAGGGSFTPLVIVVTPTVLPATASAQAQALTPTAGLVTPTLPPTAATTTPAGGSTTGTASNRPAATLLVSSDNRYTIQSGDTLLGIAIRLGVDYDDLVDLNNITEPNKLKIDQVLKVPPRKSVTPGPTPTKK